MTGSRWSEADDERTAQAVRAAFAEVQMTRSVPTMTDARLDGEPRRSLRRARRWVAATAGAAAAALAITVGAAVVGGSGAAAWAAVPAATTAADAAMAVEQCTGPFTSPSREGGATASPVSVEASTLQVLDMRGVGAIAIFAEGDTSLTCTLAKVDGSWTFAGATASDEASEDAISAIAGMSTTLPDGSAFSSLHGYADAGTVAVTVTLASGVQAEASLGADGNARVFAVWFPVPIEELAGAAVTAVDVNGQATELPALSISQDVRVDAR